MISRYDRPALVLMTFWVVVWCGDGLFGASAWLFHDLAHHHYPWRSWAGATWASGFIPTWAPVGHGFPLVAEAQAGVLYPPNIILWSTLSPIVAFNVSIGLHHLLALWGSFVLARQLGRSSTASLCAAVAYGFSGFFISHLVYLGFFQVLAWFPWMIVSGIQGTRYGGGWWPALALTTAMVWLCGHPQGAYLATLAVLFVLVWQSLRVGRARGWRPVLSGALALSLAAGMSMPQWMATAELVEEGVRSDGLDERASALGSLPPEELVNAVLPMTFGYERPIDIPEVYGHRAGQYVGRGVSYWETCFYLGVPTFLMLLVAGWSKGIRMWWVLLGAGLVLMLGSNTPLYPLFRLIPGMDYFRFPVRGAMWVSLAAAMLAGSGIDRLTELARERSMIGTRRLWALSGVLLIGAGLVCALSLGLEHYESEAESWLTERLVRPEPTLQGGMARDIESAQERAKEIVSTVRDSTAPGGPQVPWFVVFGLLTVLPWFLVYRGKLSVGAPGQFLVGLLITDLFLFAFEFNPRVSVDDWKTRPESAVPLLGVSNGFRATAVEKRVHVDKLQVAMPSSIGLLWGLDDVGLPSPLRTRRNERYLEAAGLDFSPLAPQQRWSKLWEHKHLVDLSGLRFLYTVSEIRSESLREVWAGDGVRLYENTTALPRAFVVGCIEAVSDAESFEALLRNRRPAQKAIVQGYPSVEGCSLEPIGDVQAKRTSGGGWALDVNTTAPGWLVLTESYYADFEWRVDGKSVPYFRTNYLFQGIPVDAGSFEVRVSYRPMWLYGALAFSWLLLLGVLGWLSVSRFPGAHRIFLEFPVVRPQDLEDKRNKS